MSVHIPKKMYDTLFALKSRMIMGGYNKLPKDFKKFLKDNGYDFDNVSMYNMVKLTMLTLKYLCEVVSRGRGSQE